jgi:hypothetical protein
MRVHRSAVRIGPVLRSTVITVVVLMALTAGASSSATMASLPGGSKQLARAPYLTDVTPSSVRMTWATTKNNTGVVKYGTVGHCTAKSVTAKTSGTKFTVKGVTEYKISVRVTGLSAGTAYCYRITTGGTARVDLLGSNPSPSFTTPQPPDGTQPFSFDVFGDWGDTSSGAQAAVDQQIARSGAQFALSTGDVAYPYGTATNYGDLIHTGANVSAVFGPSYWAVPGQSLPMFTALGNHGQNATFLSTWPEPAVAGASGGVNAMRWYPSIDGTKGKSYPTAYYAFTVGGVRFYVLDASWDNGNIGHATGVYQVDRDAHWKTSSVEYRWLAKDLAAHPGGLKFAFFHFPLYSDTAGEPSDTYLDSPRGNSGGTGTLEQLLHAGGVQLVFNGHAHVYERNIAVPGGVTSYVTGGGGGAASPIGVRGCSTTDAYGVGWYSDKNKGTACGAAAPPGSPAQVYHYLKVSVDGTTVTVTPTDSRGSTFDIHTYDFAADSNPPSAPGGLTATAAGSGATRLAWTAASDNIGVSAYDIYRDGSYLATVGPNVTSYTVNTPAGTGHLYEVTARDLAGNTAGTTVTS